MPRLSAAFIVLLMLLARPGAGAPDAPVRPPTRVPKEIQSVLEEYRGAMEARSVERLSKVVDPALVVVENTGLNVGWADYRDHHIGPELKDMRSLRYVAPRVVDASISGDTAHAVVEGRVEIALEREMVVLAAVETFVFVKTAHGWRIRLIHWSGKRQPPPDRDAGQTAQ